MSLKIGELGVLPKMRAAAPDTLLAACGTSCRHQIADGAGATPATSCGSWTRRRRFELTPLPQCGRGWPPRSGGRVRVITAQLPQNCVDHPFRFHDFGIPEAEHPPAATSEPSRSTMVGFAVRVLASVSLDDQASNKRRPTLGQRNRPSVGRAPSIAAGGCSASGIPKS